MIPRNEFWIDSLPIDFLINCHVWVRFSILVYWNTCFQNFPKIFKKNIRESNPTMFLPHKSGLYFQPIRHPAFPTNWTVPKWLKAKRQPRPRPFFICLRSLDFLAPWPNGKLHLRIPTRIITASACIFGGESKMLNMDLLGKSWTSSILSLRYSPCHSDGCYNVGRGQQLRKNKFFASKIY